MLGGFLLELSRPNGELVFAPGLLASVFRVRTIRTARVIFGSPKFPVNFGNKPQAENWLVLLVVNVHPPFVVWFQLAIKIPENFAARLRCFCPCRPIVGKLERFLIIVVGVGVSSSKKIARHCKPLLNNNRPEVLL
jgi:hypothetical protein